MEGNVFIVFLICLYVKFFHNKKLEKFDFGYT